jgi:hypothetical protein
MRAVFIITKLLDLEVFVMGGGRERTQNDYRVLMESAGFELSRDVLTDESVSLIEAVKSDGVSSPAMIIDFGASRPNQCEGIDSPGPGFLQSQLRRRCSRRQIHPTMLM